MEKPYNMYDYKVLDRNGADLGSITGLWVDEASGKPEFAAVKTGWLLGKNHVIPIRDAYVDYAGQRLRIPYAEETIREAPSFDTDHNLSPQEEQTVYRHYRLNRSVDRRPTGLPGRTQARRGGERDVEMPLREEKVDVGKREVETGQVRLRKVVKTETREIPVELRREKIEIERVPAEKLKGTFSGRAWGDAFEEDEVVMTERREEPVIQKRNEVIGGVRAHKEIDTERRDVNANVRREDVDIDRDVEEKDRREGDGGIF